MWWRETRKIKNQTQGLSTSDGAKPRPPLEMTCARGLHSGLRDPRRCLNSRHRLQHRTLARRKTAVDAGVDLTLACRRWHRLQRADRVLHFTAMLLRRRLHRCTNHPFGISIWRWREDRRSYHLAFFRRETRVQTCRQFALTSRRRHPAQSSDGIPHFGTSLWNLPDS